MYKQKINLLYNPMVVHIPMLSYDIYVSYVDQLDNSAVEFQHSHHADFEIYYVQKGTLDIKVKNETYALDAGKFLLLNPGVKHGAIYDPTSNKEYFVIIFCFQEKITPSDSVSSSEYEQEYYTTILQYIKNKDYFIERDNYDAAQHIEAMVKECTSKAFGWQIALSFHYTSFITSILRNIIKPSNNIQGLPRMNTSILITKYMHENYPSNIHLQDVADALHITSRHVNRLFHDYFGTSFGKTLTLYRLSYAKNYLCDTIYSVEKIAELVGFSSTSTLFHLFKENEGITISEYRKLHQKNLFQK